VTEGKETAIFGKLFCFAIEKVSDCSQSIFNNQ